MSTNDLRPELNVASFNLNSLVEGTDYLSGQVIVKLKSGIESTQMQTLPETLQASVLESTNTLGTQLWQLNGLSVAQAISMYSNHPLIEYIEPNYTITLNTTIPNDSDFNQLWGLNNTGQTGGIPDADIDAPEAWDSATGNNIVVGVIDTGVDYTHPELINNMWTNPGEIPGDGIDNDGNGYVDDYYGWDFINNDNNPFDDEGHGTHVAGTIAAEGNNNSGVIGVAPNAQIMALKIFNSNGTTSLFSEIQAIEYAIMMGANLTNNSWGGGGYSQGLYDAIAAAGQAGQLFIAAAGNGGFDGIGDNNDVTPHYPSNYDLDNIICVAATDDCDNLASFSNYGVTSVDLGAPGVDIYSTIPGGGYASYNGTSMATPHVSGVAALIWSQNPQLSASEVKNQILSTVDPISSLQGNTVTGGRLNANNALDNPPPSPVFGEIHGSKWNDIDGDGIWDANERGLSGWTIYLDQNQNSQLDAGEVSTITDINGNYSFTGLTADTYTIAEVLLPGWQQTVPGSEPSFNLVAGTGSGGTNEFSLVELQTDPVAEMLIGASSFYTGLDVDPTTGLLYGASSSLRIIDSTDGYYSTIGTIHSATNSSILMRSIAFSPDGTLYGNASSTNILYTINPVTAFATEIGTISQTTWGIDFAPDGTLYGAWNNLVEIDPATGNILASVGSLGTYVVDIDFAPDGFIYGVYDSNSNLYQINPSDASKTLIGTYESWTRSVASIPSNSNLVPGTHTVDLSSGEIVTNITFGNQQIEDLSPQLNLSFETGDFTDWNSIGDATIQTDTIGSTPTDGTFQALITNGQGSVSDSNLETFLGLNPGDLDNLGNGDAIEGSALQLTPINVKAGDIVSFDWNFITNEQTPSNYNDFGFISISSTLLSELADTNQQFNRFTGSFGKQTNYGTFDYQFTQAGTYTIGLGLVDADDNSVDSGLLVDHFQITPDPFFNFGFENGDFTNWTTIGNTTIETNSIGSNPTDGNYQAFITNSVGSVSDTDMEQFFGLTAGALDNLGNGDIIEGSGLQFQPIKVQVGDSISFDWNFITNEENSSSFSDFGFVSITSGVLSELADTNSNFSRFTGSFGSQTDYGTFTHQFTESGIFTIGVGLMDAGDSYVDSGLLIDNFSFISNSGTNLGLSIPNATVETVTPEYTIQGTPDNDKLVSSNQQDEFIFADAGNDTVIGSLGDDVIYGAEGDDILRGDLNKGCLNGAIAGDDILYGGTGNDKLRGKGGNDQLFGEDGNDKIWGDDGDDLLWGGLGHDQLIGGQGYDTFILAVGEGTDKIRDFHIVEDVLGLSGELTFEQLSIAQHGKNTWIDFNQETLAVLTGVNASTLTADAFVLM
ncbi:MAG: S8 family serine peptidase [Coleofasciculus chthonoplastes F3-SA18-01]|uniref:S8 family serine peptidase n=1 Tax=Coleofasciculus chthonoplastes TaxID=64178 RepID=UPI0032F21F4A